MIYKSSYYSSGLTLLIDYAYPSVEDPVLGPKIRFFKGIPNIPIVGGFWIPPTPAGGLAGTPEGGPVDLGATLPEGDITTPPGLPSPPGTPMGGGGPGLPGGGYGS